MRNTIHNKLVHPTQLLHNVCIAVLYCSLMAFAPQPVMAVGGTFSVRTDTVHTGQALWEGDRWNWPYMAWEYRGNYWFIRYDTYETARVVGVSGQGEVAFDRSIPLTFPTDTVEDYRLFVRNDSLLVVASDYLERPLNVFCLAPSVESDGAKAKPLLGQYTFIPIDTTTGQTYEDKHFRVYPIGAGGEFGTFLSFIDKRHGGSQYVYDTPCFSIARIRRTYYMVGAWTIQRLRHPDRGQQYGGESRYELEHHGYTRPETLLSRWRGTSGWFQETTYIPHDYHYLQAFSIGRRLYFLRHGNDGSLHVATYDHGEVVLVSHIYAGGRTKILCTSMDGGDNGSNQGRISVTFRDNDDQFYFVNINRYDIHVTLLMP